MKPRTIIVIFLIAALMLACNLSTIASNQTPAPGNAPTQTESPPAAVPTITGTPLSTDIVPAGYTPTISPTPTSSVPMVIPVKDAVNCRFGPQTTFESIGKGLAVGSSAQIFGKSADGSWWQIQNPSPPNDKCWVAASVTTASGDLTTVGVVAPPEALITNVTISVKPDSINLGVGCPGPAPLFSLKGTIQVNGPIEVKWHFATQKDGALPTHTTSFSQFGIQNMSADYSPLSLEKGNYWVRLVITSPVSMSAEASYQLKCSA